jgi:hypothetical protein
MAKSSIVVSTLAAALIAGSVGLAHAQTGGGGGHRQPNAGDLPQKDSQASKRDKRDKNADRLIGSICRGC